MNIVIHLQSNLAHFFLEWEMFQTKVVEKTKTHVTPVHKTTHQLLRTSATTPSAEHHMQ